MTFCVGPTTLFVVPDNISRVISTGMSKKRHYPIVPRGTSKLPPRQLSFVQHYLINHNATKSAIAAGYSRRSAAVQASKLLRKAKIKNLLEKSAQKVAAKLDISAENVLRELSLIAFANLGDYMRIEPDGNAVVDLTRANRDRLSAVQDITVDQYGGGSGDGERKQVVRTRFKLAPKVAALELLGKHLELFTEKIKHTGELPLEIKLSLGTKNGNSDDGPAE